MIPKLFSTFLLLMAVGLVQAGTLTVQSPSNDAIIGANNTLSFVIREAVREVTVRADVTNSSGVSSSVQGNFTPNVEGVLTNSLTINFPEGLDDESYTIVVSATEQGNTYTSVTLGVRVDSRKPQLERFSPVNNTFVKGLVSISAVIRETNLKEWRIKTTGNVPLRSGTTSTINATWDTSGIQFDGAQTVILEVEDLARNTLTQTISLTLDRTAPTSTIQFPTTTTKVRPRSNVNVIIDVEDQQSGVDVTGIDVTLVRTDGTLIGRISRIAFTQPNATTRRWTGRINLKKRSLPKRFKIIVNVIDRAGNRAAQQEVTVNVG